MQAGMTAIIQVYDVLVLLGTPVPKGAIAGFVAAEGGENWSANAISKTLYRLEATGAARQASPGHWEAVPDIERPLRAAAGYPARNVRCYGDNAAELEECALAAATQFFGYEADLVMDTAYHVDDVLSPANHAGHTLTCFITVYCLSPRAPEMLSC